MPISYMEAASSSALKEPKGVNSKVYDRNGSYTFTVPTGVTEIYVAVFGAGGSGGLASSGNTTGGGGGGFAGGFLSVSEGAEYAVTVGKGGLRDNTNSSDGNDGGTSSFGTFLTATGGKGGTYTASGTGTNYGGLGGTGTATADVINASTASGGRGGDAYYIANTKNLCYTGGGASGSPLGDGGRGGDIYSMKSGGDTFTGGGGWGNGHGGDINTQLSSGNHATGGGGAMHKASSVHLNSTTNYGIGGSPYGSVGSVVNASTASDYNKGFRAPIYPPTYFNLLHGRLFTASNTSRTDEPQYIGVGGCGETHRMVHGGMCAGNAGGEHSNLTNGIWFVATGGGNGMYVFYSTELTETYSHTMAAGNASGSGGMSSTSYVCSGGEGIVFVLW